MLKKSSSKFVTIDDISDLEEDLIVNSPRSIEACLREGIKPKDLLHIPEEEFTDYGLSNQVKHLHYEFYEAKRKELLYSVKRTRKNIISESEGQTRSSTAVQIFSQNSKQAERAKAIKIKQVCKKLEREELARYVLKQRNIERNLSYEKTVLANWMQAEKIKKINDRNWEKHLKLKKKIEKESIENESIRMSLTMKLMKESENLLSLEKEKLVTIENKRRNHETKTKKYNQKMEKRWEKIQKLRELNLIEKDFLEKERREKIILNKVKKQKILEAQWNAKIKKKEEMKRKINEDILQRQIEYYRLKEIKDKRFEELQIDFPKVHRIESCKWYETDKNCENENLQKMQKLEKKNQESEARIHKIKKEEKRKIEYKKQLNTLKKLKQDWNLQRIQNKDEYMKSLSKLKFEAKFQEVSRMEYLKTQQIERSLEYNAKEEIQNQKLDERMLKMITTKIWNKNELLNVINQPIFQNYSKGRSSISNKFF